VDGVKNDAGKPRWDLVPFDTLADVVDVLTQGANKYGDTNWTRLANGQERCFAAMMRHVARWRNGEARDKKSGKPHLAHAIANAMFVLHFDKKQDDRDDPPDPRC
jgi:hypothetical protein